MFACLVRALAGRRLSGLWVVLSIVGGVVSMPARATDANNLSSTSATTQLTIGSLDSLTVPAPTGMTAGTLPGNADVAAGRATYHVDLPVPPGVNGLVPSVGLSYGGGTDINLLGIGWSLHATSSIQRCPPTIVQDGVMDTVRLTNADRLCMDGQRLVPATALPANCDKAHAGTGATQWPACFNTVYWGAATEYRTEVESGTRILRITGGFQVYTRDGRIHWYGNAETATDKFVRNGADGTVHTWVLRQTQDRWGNAIEYAYYKDPTNVTGEHYLTQIRYGRNDAATQSSFARVDFEYEARPDAETYYIATGRADRTKRLLAISTWTDTAADGTGGSRATRLVMGYGLSATSGRSLVTSLQWYGAWDGEVLPATTFSYGQKDPNATPRFVQRGTANSAGPVLEDAPAANQVDCATTGHVPGNCGHRVSEMFVTGDFNGDGVPDLLTKFADVGSIKLYLTDPAGVFSYGGDAPFGQSLDTTYVVVGVGDFDGDGQSDVLLASKVLGPIHGLSGGSISGNTYKNWKICFSRLRTTGAFACQEWAEAGQLDAQGFSQSDLFKVYDFDGDGRDDVYLSGSLKENKHIGNAGPQRLCMATGSGFACQAVANQIVNLDNGISPSTGGGAESQPRIGRAATDIDGDGHADIVQFLGPYKNCGSPDVQCTPSTPFEYSGTGAQVSSYNTVRAQEEFFAFTLDDRTLPGYQVSTTSMFGDVVAGDLNGDGYSDLFINYAASSGSPRYYRRCQGTGNTTAACTQITWPSGVPQARYVTDMDGDGINHLFMAYNGSPITSCYVIGTAMACPTTWTTLVAPASGSVGDFSNDAEVAHDDWMDLSGNGTLDRVLYDVGGKWTVLSPASLAKSGEALDRLVLVTDGLGKKTQFVYALPGDTGVYQPDAKDKDGVTVPVSYPARRVPRMGTLVRTMKMDNGQGGWVERDYAYSGATRDLTGRGFLGFARVDVTDVRVASPRSGTTASQWFAAGWPYIGTPVASRTQSAAGTTLMLATFTLASTTNVLASAPETTTCPYVANRSEQRWDLSGDYFGKTSTDVSGVDAFCNVTDTTTTTTWNPSGLHTSTTHVDFNNDTTRWCLAQPTTTKVTNVRDGVTVVRTIGATYASDATCAVLTQVVEPNDASGALTLTTTLDRSTSDTDPSVNKFGLVRRTTQQWKSPSDGTTRTRTAKEVLTREPKSRFEQQVRNAVGHVVETARDNRNGTVIWVKDPNGLLSARPALPTRLMASRHRMLSLQLIQSESTPNREI